MSDASQKTEQPTQQRIRKSREKGQYLSSRELVYAVQFVVALALLGSPALLYRHGFLEWFRTLLASSARGGFSEGRIQRLLQGEIPEMFLPMAAAGFGVFGLGLLTQMAISGFGIATAKLAPDLSRLNPMSRLKNLPKQNLSMALQALVIAPVSFAILWLAVVPVLDQLMQLPALPVRSGVASVAELVSRVLMRLAILLLIWGGIDFYRQKKKHNKELMMTKQEIREENRESEGSPEIKARIRRVMREMMRKRMMSDVPKATVVITNPTHYAVAIRYHLKHEPTPRVVASGRDHLALRIRGVAQANGVPILENKPMAQGLYRACKVGQVIPPDLYRAVAEVLAYVYRIDRSRMTG